MATLNFLISPLDPFQTIDPPREGDQNSHYDNPGDRSSFDVNSIWHEYQMEYGRHAMINPIVDWFSLYYSGSSHANDLDLMASSFDLMSAIFWQNGTRPWFVDNQGSYRTYHGDAVKVNTTTLDKYFIKSSSAVTQGPGGSGDIIITGTISRPWSASDLHFISLNLQDAEIRIAGEQVYQNAANTILSRATGALIHALRNFETTFSGHSWDNDYTYHISQVGIYVNINVGQEWDRLSRFEYNVVSGLSVPYGYGGQTGMKADGTGWYSNVDSSMLSNYFQQYGNAGIYWYVIHEFVHNFDDVKAYERAQAAAYVQRTGDSSYGPGWSGSPGQPASQEFRNIEMFTNEVTRQFSQNLGFPVHPNPPGGYFPN